MERRGRAQGFLCSALLSPLNVELDLGESSGLAISYHHHHSTSVMANFTWLPLTLIGEGKKNNIFSWYIHPYICETIPFVAPLFFYSKGGVKHLADDVCATEEKRYRYWRFRILVLVIRAFFLPSAREKNKSMLWQSTASLSLSLSLEKK